MTIDTAIFALALITLPALIGANVLVQRSRRVNQQQRHQITVLAAELADVRASRDVCLRSLNIAIQENAKLRRGRPLILNGRMYAAYRIMPESIYKN